MGNALCYFKRCKTDSQLCPPSSIKHRSGALGGWDALSKDLAEHTYKSLGIEKGIRKYDIVGQTSHGVCAVDRNPWDAFEHIERVEHIYQIIMASGVKPPVRQASSGSKASGKSKKPLDSHQTMYFV